MCKPIIISIPFVLLFLCTHPLSAQQKYESESRLSQKEVPAKALDFIDALAVKGKMRWYLEEGLERSSIEAKFKLNQEKYSVEFDTLGNLEDIEIQVKWNELPLSLRDSIHTQLKKDCKKAKIRKVQIQYSGDPAILLSTIKKEESSGNFTVRYELVVKCRTPNKVALFEYLFSDTGQQLSVSQIILNKSSNLEY